MHRYGCGRGGRRWFRSRRHGGRRGRLCRVRELCGRLLGWWSQMEASRLRRRERLLYGSLGGLLYGRLSGPLACPACLACLGGRCGAGGAESGGKRPDLVEDLDRLFVGAGVRKHLDGGRERLASSRGGTEPDLRIGLQQTGQYLPQRLRDALGSARGAVVGEVLDQSPGVGLLALEEIERDQTDRKEIGREVRLRTEHLLGREIAGRAHHIVGLGEARLALAHGDPEIGQP